MSNLALWWQIFKVEEYYPGSLIFASRSRLKSFVSNILGYCCTTTTTTFESYTCSVECSWSNMVLSNKHITNQPLDNNYSAMEKKLSSRISWINSRQFDLVVFFFTESFTPAFCSAAGEPLFTCIRITENHAKVQQCVRNNDYDCWFRTQNHAKIYCRFSFEYLLVKIFVIYTKHTHRCCPRATKSKRRPYVDADVGYNKDDVDLCP